MLDQSTLKHLTPDEAAKARAFEVLFGSEGWKAFLEIIQSQYQLAEQQVLRSSTWADNRIAFGRLSAFGDILLFEEQIAKEYENAVASRKADAEQEAMEAELEYE